jgi:2'-5' RNA ligase
VTVKAQPGLDQPSFWLDHIANWSATYPPVAVRLGEPRFFGDEILYLSITGAAIDKLHRALLGCLDAIGVTERFEYEADAYVPHLTLSATWLGRCVEELAGIAEHARSSFRPTEFTARTLSVFRSLDGVHYERWRELPLSYV